RTVSPISWEGMDAMCLRFEQFLEEIFADRDEYDRQELLDFLQKLIGYWITGDTSSHLFSIFAGEEGRNGKGVLMNTLKGVLGPLINAVSNDVLISANSKYKQGGSAAPHLLDLQGLRLAWCSE